MRNEKVLKLVLVALLIAVNIILNRVISIQTPITKITFSFLPIALAGIMFGPITGGLAAAVADIIGVLLAATGTPHPGITLVAFLSGATYGLILNKKPVTFLRVLVACLIISLCWNLLLNTYWISQIIGKGYIALLAVRAPKYLIEIPIHTILIPLSWELVRKSLPPSMRGPARRKIEVTKTN